MFEVLVVFDGDRDLLGLFLSVQFDEGQDELKGFMVDVLEEDGVFA